MDQQLGLALRAKTFRQLLFGDTRTCDSDAAGGNLD